MHVWNREELIGTSSLVEIRARTPDNVHQLVYSGSICSSPDFESYSRILVQQMKMGAGAASAAAAGVLRNKRGRPPGLRAAAAKNTVV